MSYVSDTLELGQGEQRARFGEMSEEERAEFVRLSLEQYEEAGLDADDFYRAVPEAK